MKFICLGCMDEKKWNAMSKSGQDAMLEECFAYDDMLLSSGHWMSNGEAPQSARTAKTLQWTAPSSYDRSTHTFASVSHFEQLSNVSEAELVKLHGLGPSALEQIRSALHAIGKRGLRVDVYEKNHCGPASIGGRLHRGA
jgi:hypothetical protein